jgi:hypothetical protein
MVIDPGPGVMLTFGPAVRVVSTGALPVEPIKICPLLAASVEATFEALEK